MLVKSCQSASPSLSTLRSDDYSAGKEKGLKDATNLLYSLSIFFPALTADETPALVRAEAGRATSPKISQEYLRSGLRRTLLEESGPTATITQTEVSRKTIVEQ